MVIDRVIGLCVKIDPISGLRVGGVYETASVGGNGELLFGKAWRRKWFQKQICHHIPRHLPDQDRYDQLWRPREEMYEAGGDRCQDR